MIQLKVGGVTKYFNLKDRGREKSLFEAWYAMSDMPKYLNRIIKITTDKNEHLSYTVGEIEDCIFIDADYVYVEKKDPLQVSVSPDTVEKLFDKYFPSKSDISEDVKKMFCKSFSDLPVKTLGKFFEFTAKVMAAGYLIEPNNEVVNGIIKDILLGDDDDDINKYVDRYIEDRKRKKLC